MATSIEPQFDLFASKVAVRFVAEELTKGLHEAADKMVAEIMEDAETTVELRQKADSLANGEMVVVLKVKKRAKKTKPQKVMKGKK